MHQQKLTPELSERIDIYRWILSVMVVYIHSYSGQINFASGAVSLQMPLWLDRFQYIVSEMISRCAVPGFFLASAFLLYRKPFSWQENMKKKLKTLGLPYLVLNALWIGIFFVAQALPFTRDYFSGGGNIIKNWGIREFCDAFLGYSDCYPFLYPLWFLRDLLVLNLLSKILWKLIDKAPNVMLAAALILWLTVESTGIFFLDIQGLCFWSLGGILVRKNIQLQRIDKTSLLLLTVGYLLLGIVDMATKELQISILLHRAFLIFGVVYWFAFTKLLTGEKIKPSVLRLSKYSFSVFLFHEFTVTIVRKLAAKVFPISALSQLLQYICLPLLVVGLCILASICLKKWLPKIHCLLIGGRG